MRYVAGETDYTAAWVFLFFFGTFGLHRFYMGDVLFGILYLLTFGMFFLGVIYDILTLNEQVSRINYSAPARHLGACSIR